MSYRRSLWRAGSVLFKDLRRNRIAEGIFLKRFFVVKHLGLNPDQRHKPCLYSHVSFWGQCWGSGSVGFVCFWASRILPSWSKNSKKNLDFYSFCNFFMTVIFEEWWKCISVPNPDTGPYVFGPSGSACGSVSKRYGSKDPDPHPPIGTKCHGSPTPLWGVTVSSGSYPHQSWWIRDFFPEPQFQMQIRLYI